MSNNQLLRQELTRNFPAYIEFEPAFHQTVVDHFDYLRRSPQHIQTFDVDELTAAMFKGDFHGLLSFKQVDVRFHFIYTQFNGFKQSSDYLGTTGKFLKISPEFLISLKKTYQSRRL